jgi:5-methylcytosine-specific restriction endonuclease McrA
MKICALLLLLFASAPIAESKGSISRHPRNECVTCAGRSEAGLPFERTHPCPSTGRTNGSCPGYVIDHVVPLKRGGADTPANMQWQSKAAAKAKDKTK